jgi:glycosyltransferase involved in cell wall biosynthesis
MRLVIDALSARLGGGQTYLHNLLRGYPDSDDEIYVLVPPSFKFDIENPQIRVLRVGAWAENPLLRALWQRFVLPRSLRRIGANLLFCPGGIVSTRAPAACRTVTMFRNMIPFDRAQRPRAAFGYPRLRNWLLERILLKSMQSADLVIFLAEHAKRVIEERISGRLRDTAVIPHGVGASFFRGMNSTVRPAWLPMGDYVLYVSSIDFYKAQLEVVQAFALLMSRGSRMVEKLVVAGSEIDKRYARSLRKEIAHLGVGNKVILAGPVAYHDLPALYQHAKVNIFASECENCPNILLEAMASGRPVLCSSISPMPEFGGNAVLYFNPRDPADLSYRLEEVLGQPDMQRRLGELGVARAAMYDWHRTAFATSEALSRVSKGSRLDHRHLELRERSNSLNS